MDKQTAVEERDPAKPVTQDPAPSPGGSEPAGGAEEADLKAERVQEE